MFYSAGFKEFKAYVNHTRSVLCLFVTLIARPNW